MIKSKKQAGVHNGISEKDRKTNASKAASSSSI